MTPLERVEDEALVEALLLSEGEPMTVEEIAGRLPPGANVMAALTGLSTAYAGRAIQVVEVAGGWTLRTRPEASGLCRAMLAKPVRLSKAAQETLAVIACFQPVTRPEIERVRGVALAKGTLDILIWSGFVRPGARRQTPGNPLTFVTTEAFLRQYSLAGLDELPGMDRMREQKLLDVAPDVGALAQAAESALSEES